MAGTVRNIRFTPDNDAYLEKEGSDNITAFVNSVLDMVRTGQLVTADSLATEGKSKEELEKAKLIVETSIKTQQAAAMQTFQNLKAEHQRLLIEKTQLQIQLAKLKLQHQGAVSTTTSTNSNGDNTLTATKSNPSPNKPALHKPFLCVNGCGIMLAWPVKYDDKNPYNNRPVELDTGLKHQCPKYHPKGAQAVKETARQANLNDLVIGCHDACGFKAEYSHFADSAEPLEDMEHWIRKHARERHGRDYLHDDEDPHKRAAEMGVSA
ncbi:MAG: hypothetical protein AB1753_08420 [Thermoproteota archaeon]